MTYSPTIAEVLAAAMAREDEYHRHMQDELPVLHGMLKRLYPELSENKEDN